MQEIVSSISKSKQNHARDYLASEEQRLGVEQIAVAINQMDTVVQQMPLWSISLLFLP